jgi:hypothetical protein
MPLIELLMDVRQTLNSRIWWNVTARHYEIELEEEEHVKKNFFYLREIDSSFHCIYNDV